MDVNHLYNYFISTPSSTMVIGVVVSLLFLCFLRLTWKTSSKLSKLKEPPVPAGRWPIIGHLLVLGGPDLPHTALGKLAEKYGPVFAINIGVHKSLIVSDWEVKECFTINDKIWSSHPCPVAMKIMGTAMFGFSPYGHYWRELRKIMNREVLSHTRIKSLHHVWALEINTSVKELYETWREKNDGGGPFLHDMTRWVCDLTLNMSVKMAVGKRYNFRDASEDDEAARCQYALREFFRLVGLFIPSDALPFLGWLDIGGYQKVMKKRLLSGPNKKGAEKDFMDVMMNILEDENTKL
ncbi:hypothetical protein MKX01_037068, partial [Papaver californicum]